MSDIMLKDIKPTSGVTLEREGEGWALTIPAAGGGIVLDGVCAASQRFLVFDLDVREQHCAVMSLNCIEPGGALGLEMRFGAMPFKARICLDMNWMDAAQLFPGHTCGQLKVVIHGHRVHRSALERVELRCAPCYHDVHLYIENLRLTDERPTEYPLPDVKLIDKFGQLKTREWPGKTHTEQELVERLRAALNAEDDGYPVASWDRYGGDSARHMADGTGFFRALKQNGRWYLLDPDGNAFFSTGPDCTVIRSDARIDGMEGLLDELPDRNELPELFVKSEFPTPGNLRKCELFSYTQWNLRRAFGEGWFSAFAKYVGRMLRGAGMNTLGNWSERELFARAGLPYVMQLSHFPTTQTLIFRDFPDVYSPEYARNADESARELSKFRNDRYMIGYFLRNEPSWAFVDGLIIADEVLHTPQPSYCRAALKDFLRERYGDIAALNAAWGTAYDSYDALDEPIECASALSAASNADMREFSRRMLDLYVGTPARACRRVDPNHMNLGMRWAWISDPDIVTGWKYFDVFSINCYSFDPTAALDNVGNLGVDLPVMIGEFHFGAIDAGLPSTGLKAVPDQHERAKAYRYYCERVAAHPQGVGCHYFQCFDQFALGRFDGENYNIGLLDVTLRPYDEMFNAARESAQHIYAINAGEAAPTDEQARTIPMIAF